MCAPGRRATRRSGVPFCAVGPEGMGRCGAVRVRSPSSLTISVDEGVRRTGGVMAASSPILPGRLGTPEMTLRDDPRADPRMIAALAPLGLTDRHDLAPVNADSPLRDLLEYVNAAEEAFEQLNAAL